MMKMLLARYVISEMSSFSISLIPSKGDFPAGPLPGLIIRFAFSFGLAAISCWICCGVFSCCSCSLIRSANEEPDEKPENKLSLGEELLLM